MNELVNEPLPKWLALYKEAHAIRDQSEKCDDMQTKDDLSRLAFDKYEDAVIEAVRNGVGWRKGALQEFSRLRGKNSQPQNSTKERISFLKDVLRRYPNTSGMPLSPKGLVKIVLSDEHLFQHAQQLWSQLEGKKETDIESQNCIQNFIYKHKICN